MLWSVQEGGPRKFTGPDEHNQSEALGDDPPFYKVDLDLDSLNPMVFVAPDASRWVVELVEKLVERDGHTWPVRQSDLYTDPIW
jgi:hypothetical protein